MPGRSFKVARIAGIPVGISPWWFAVVALFTWSLGAGYFPAEVKGISSPAAYGLALASVLLLFASILAHEFGHALVARRRGVEIEEIDLWLLGGVSRMRGQPRTAVDELLFALAGPAVTAGIAGAFGLAWLLVPNTAPSAVRALIAYEAEVNALILVFNLIPAFPLDGGRIARAALWHHSGDLSRATETAARIGRAFGYLMVAFGILLVLEGAVGGLWIAFIGLFVVAGASAEQLHEELMTSFTGVQAQDVMSRSVISVGAGMTPDEARAVFERYHHPAFPVTDSGGCALGLLTIDALERALRSPEPTGTIAPLADRDPGLLVSEREDVTHLLEQPAFARIGRAAVLDHSGRPIGLVSITDLEREVRARRLHDRNGTRDGYTRT